MQDIALRWFLKELDLDEIWGTWLEGSGPAPGTVSIRPATQCFLQIDITWADLPGLLAAAKVYLATRFSISYLFFLSDAICHR